MDHYLIPRKIASGFASFLLVLAGVHATGILPAGRLAGSIPVFCPFELLTGIPCPGCGMTRAVLCLIAGNPSDALLYNPFSFFLIALVTASILPRRWLERVPTVIRAILPHAYFVILGLVITFWIFDRLLPALTT
ncbi:MAG: hypothetical protein A4E61_01753 [Syntrophorhabdus sp. PtaB.Bin184]|jgi:hypothetical protein|nr:MAG: hypothetical protein A4E61_01753 [Syntrophorhabdus sp. PtaB.Bin184]